MSDESIFPGTRLPPGTRFKKVWRVRNTGTKAWNSRTTLKYCWGNELFDTEGKIREIPVPRLKPWEEGRITLPFIAPSGHFHGQYQSHWRLHHRNQPFGQRLICQVIVDPKVSMPDDSLLDVSAGVFSSSHRHVSKSLKKSLKKERKREMKERAAEGIEMANWVKDLTKKENVKVVHLSSNPKKMEEVEKDLGRQVLKVLRFQDENPIKSQLQSYTTTPTNTPFDGPSPPKTPEPKEAVKEVVDQVSSSTDDQVVIEDVVDEGATAAPIFQKRSSTVSLTRDFGFSPEQSFEQFVSTEKLEIQQKVKELVEKETQVTRESTPVRRLSHDLDARGCLLTPDEDFSWASSAAESSDEYVVVPLPSCFDLMTPFDLETFNEMSEELARKDAEDSSDAKFVELTPELPSEESTEKESQENSVVVPEAPSTTTAPVEEETAKPEVERRSPILVDLVSSDDESSSSSLSDYDMDRLSPRMIESFTQLGVEDCAETDEDEEKEPEIKEEIVQDVKYQLLPQEGSSAGTTPLSSVNTDSTSADSEISAPGQTEVKVPVTPVASSSSDSNGAATGSCLHPSNPFLMKPIQKGENVIHVLPEAIVNGAVSAATQAIQNVTRVLFSPQVSYSFVLH